ncbi:alpha-crystallin A chain-like [Babylonia areolata]|uniref:alpha-crystallin A chain-like n=1 Tax=Babylonia areolata TaxID=304850 RepID=UPI003FD3A42E
MEHLVPLRRTEWGFFDRQKSLFSSMFKDMDDEFLEFDRELEKMKKELFTLEAMDFDDDFGDFGSMLGSKGSSMLGSKGSSMLGSKKGAASSSLLQVDRPIVQDKDGNKRLSLRFDCKDFKPEEITVKTVDNRLMVQAKHTEESPGRKVYREFSRQYVLPDKIDPVTLNSILAADGVLSIEGPAPASVEAPRERILPIRML